MNQRLFGLLIAGSIACATTEAPNTRQDRETRFELTRDPKRSVSTIYSRLSDLP